MNITLCDDGDICLNHYMEMILVAISTIILTANILQLIFLSQLKQHKGRVFHLSVRLVTCCDVVSSLLRLLTSSCLWRQSVELSYPNILYVRSFITFFNSSFICSMYIFSIADRWLMLAKPFEYENHFFIRNFTKVTIFAFFNNFVSTPSVFIIQYYVSGNLPCYDTVYGMLFCHPSTTHICFIPILLVNFLIITFAVFFFIEYGKMRKRQHIRDHNDRENRQSAHYICLSTLSNLLSSVLWLLTVCFILSQSVQAVPIFKIITILVDQLTGIWNVLALYVVMDSYRNKLKEFISSFLIRRRNMVRVGPALDTSHMPSA